MNLSVKPRVLAVAVASVCALSLAHAQSGSEASRSGSAGSSSGAMAGSAHGGSSGHSASAGMSQSGQSGQSGQKLSRADAKFIEQAALSGMAEVASSELAAKKASSDQVKTFAKQMVDEHRKSNEQLMSLAQARGVTPPTQVDREHQRAMEKLEKLSGAEFDREYMAMQAKDHRKAVQLYEKQAKDGKDPELKSFAQAQLPHLKEHLTMAKTTTEATKSAAAGGSQSGSSQSGSMSAQSGSASGSSSGMGSSSGSGASRGG